MIQLSLMLWTAAENGVTIQAWFYELQSSGGQLLAEHDYLGSVETMQLNEHWAATIFEGEPAL